MAKGRGEAESCCLPASSAKRRNIENLPSCVSFLYTLHSPSLLLPSVARVEQRNAECKGAAVREAEE